MNLGYKIDLPDARDRQVSALNLTSSELPDSVNFSGHVVDVLNQGETESCVAQAAAQAVRTAWSIQGAEPKLISRRDVYYRARRRFDPSVYDGGCYPRSAWAALREGYMAETSHPWEGSKGINNPTPFQALREAFVHSEVLEYYRCSEDSRRVNQIRALLAQLTPVCVGISVDEAFRRLGPWHEPYCFKGPRLGRHYVMLCGYDDERGAFRAVNSWGESWGEKGYFWLSYVTVSSPLDTTDPVGLIVAPPMQVSSTVEIEG